LRRVGFGIRLDGRKEGGTVRCLFLLAVLLLFGVVTTTQSVAQLTGGKVSGLQIIEKPLKYQNPTSDKDFAPDTERVPLKQWIVYSDRDGNKTYSVPQGISTRRTLDFLDQFYVVEERGEYVRIAKDPSPSGLTLSDSSEDFGWIHKSKLLLWEHCLASTETNTPNKVMIQNTLTHFQQNGRSAGKQVEFWRSPETQALHASFKSQLLNFFFLLKSEGDWALLSTVQYIGGRSLSVRLDTLVVGWIPWARLVQWYTRIAVEPNWEPAACTERAQGRKAKVFVSEEAALQYRNGEMPSGDEIWWDADSLTQRPAGEWRRFPVLKASTSSPGVFMAMAQGSTPGTRDIAVEAYLAYKVKNQRYPLFKKVILLSRDELYSCVNKMQELISSRKSRQSLVEGWLQLVKGATTSAADGELLGQSLSSLNERIFGLSPQDGFALRTRLADIYNTSIVEDEELARYLDSMQEKMLELQRIADTEERSCPYVFRSNGVAYYWISEDLLP